MVVVIGLSLLVSDDASPCVFHFISSALPLGGGAYPMKGVDVVVAVVVVVVVRQLLFQIATPPKLLARSFSNFTQQ